MCLIPLMKITGVMVQYYIACKRELWFFANHINMNYDNVCIQLGRLIHEKSFSQEKKNISIDNIISFDFIKKKGNIVVFEIKKSSRLEEPVRWQLYYYLWYLKQKGIEAEGILTYPKERKREKVTLKKEIEERFPEILKDIESIVKEQNPPKPEKKPYCKKCTYYELCWV